MSSAHSSAAPLAFYATPPHPCSYLAGRQAVTVFADPGSGKDRRLYTALSQCGFRRSGAHVYRPHCPDCSACVPVRLSVGELRPRRSHRRAWRANAGLRARAVPARFHPEHYALYSRYVSQRHSGGGMDHPTPAQYLEFLTSGWAETLFYEFREDRELLAVAVVDRLEDGLSAVYTFYAPELTRRGLGTYAVLWEVEEARRLGLPWLYLGYWIHESPKMRYKATYQPLEYFYEGRWQPLPPP